MIAQAELSNKLRTIDSNPSSLLQAEGREESFMKEWYAATGTETERREFSYVWSLLYGWDLERLSSANLIIAPTPTNTEILLSKEKNERFPELFPEFAVKSRSFLEYISKNEMVIQFQSNLIWINPTDPINLPIDPAQSLIFVLSTANIVQILNLLQFSTAKAKLITTETIYRKIKFLSNFLAEDNSLVLPVTYLLKPDEYFQYGKITWLMRENCWLEPTYDLQITFPHTRQSFLLESPKLEEAKLIYFGWKKGLITENNYQKYIREWDRAITRTNSKPFEITALPPVMKEKIDWYLTFTEKELIETLESQEQDQLFGCCEIIELIPNQIIAKKGYRFDHLFLLLEGEFELRDPRQQARAFKFYGLNQLKKKEETYQFTLASVTAGKILRIDKGNVLFHLYDMLH